MYDINNILVLVLDDWVFFYCYMYLEVIIIVDFFFLIIFIILFVFKCIKKLIIGFIFV